MKRVREEFEDYKNKSNHWFINYSKQEWKFFRHLDHKMEWVISSERYWRCFRNSNTIDYIDFRLYHLFLFLFLGSKFEDRFFHNQNMIFFSSPSMIMLISDLFDQQIIIKAKFVSVFIIIKWSFYFSPITMGIGQSKDFDTSKLGSFWDVIVLDDTPIETFLGELLNQW